MAHERDCGCQEYNSLSRRQFFGASGTAAATAAAAVAWMPRVVLAKHENTSRDVLINIFLRGGCDGLSMVVPHGDPEYANARPTQAVPTAKSKPLDKFFGLSEPLWPLYPAYLDGNLLAIHATGSTDPTRSHFDAQKYMEYGVPVFRDPSVVTGWLGRHLMSTSGKGPLRALAISSTLPRALSGAPMTLPLRNVSTFDLDGRNSTINERRQLLTEAYEAMGGIVGDGGLNTFETIDLLKKIDFANYRPSNNVTYPANSFGRSMQTVAALIKSEVGVEVLEVDRGGWDTHSTQGTLDGTLAARMTEVSTGIAALYADLLATHINRVTILVHSEFGRRVEENGSGGTDHGHGNCMFVIGGNINGGQVLAKWPGLAIPYRWRGFDLDITIDYRDIFSEIVEKRLGNGALDFVFPRYTPNFHNIASY